MRIELLPCCPTEGATLVCESVTVEGERPARLVANGDVGVSLSSTGPAGRLEVDLACPLCGGRFALVLENGSELKGRLSERIDLGNGNGRSGISSYN